MIMIITVVY